LSIVRSGKVDNKDCAAVILQSAEDATKTALDAIQCLGGNGYINGMPLPAALIHLLFGSGRVSAAVALLHERALRQQ
jgi:alkylation response protein AidB-like acyl-CoA dehydrogenase